MEKETVRISDEQVLKKQARVLEIEEKIQTANKPGMLKLADKEKNKLETEHRTLSQELAAEFLPRYNELVKFFGMEVRAVMEVKQFQPNVAQAVTRLMPYRENKGKELKEWHEAMADNLHARAKCEHVEHAEGDICEKCGLVKSNWGTSGKGVSAEYLKTQTGRIEEEKKKAEATKEE